MRRIRFRLPPVFVAVALIGGVLTVYVWYNRAMDAFFDAVTVGNNGAIRSAEQWPRPLKELVARAASEQVELRDVDVYCIADGMIREYIWRMPSTPGLFPMMQDEFDLYEDDARARKVSLRFDGSPTWWSPQKTPKSQFYLGRHSNIGEKGDKFCVVDDEPGGFIYVYYNENW